MSEIKFSEIKRPSPHPHLASECIAADGLPVASFHGPIGSHIDEPGREPSPKFFNGRVKRPCGHSRFG